MRIFNHLAYVHGRELGDLPPLVGMHRREWKELYGLQSLEHLQRIIRNVGDHIVASYPLPLLPEANLPLRTDDPGCFLRPIRIRTGGNPEKIPETFQLLTGNHTFDTHDPDGDTIVFVDVTSNPNHRRQRRGHDMIEYALGYADEVGIPYRFTFSPYRETYFELARNLHVDHGAKPLLMRPGARPGFSLATRTFGDVLVEDVIVMGYPDLVLPSGRPRANPAAA